MGLHPGMMPYEQQGLQDAVWLGRGETGLVEARYRPWGGFYMFPCHDLIHEDHDMVVAFHVIALGEGLGYKTTTDFADPIDARWRARPYAQADYAARSDVFSEQAVRDAVDTLAMEQPYSEREGIEEAITDYYRTHEQGNPNYHVALGQDPSGQVVATSSLDRSALPTVSHLAAWEKISLVF